MSVFYKELNTIKIFRVVTTVFLLLWMVLIFSLSAQTASVSSGTSGSLIEFLANLFYSDFSELSSNAQDEVIGSFQFIVRKGAHFTIYGILGVFSFLSIISYRNIKFSIRVILSGLICLLYAVSDEIHQIFIPGRSGEVRDVLIDFSGSLIAILFLTLISRYIKRIYRHIN